MRAPGPVLGVEGGKAGESRASSVWSRRRDKVYMELGWVLVVQWRELNLALLSVPTPTSLPAIMSSAWVAWVSSAAS